MSKQGRILSFGLACICSLWAVSLAYFAVPAATAALNRLPGDPAARRISAGELITVEGFDRLEASRSRALASGVTPASDWRDLGWSSLMRVGLPAPLFGDAEAARADNLDQAVLAFERALALNPTDGGTWLLLAWAELERGRTKPAAAALAASWRFTPVDPENAIARVTMGAYLWDALGSQGRKLAVDDVEILVLRNRDAIAAVAERENMFDDFVDLLRPRDPEGELRMRLADGLLRARLLGN